MERSEPTPVLPIVSTSHARLATHVTVRRNKMMLPKYYHLKALGGSSTNSPRETMSSLTRSLPKSTRGLERKLPPERRYRRSHDLYLKALGGSSANSPPRDAIVAHAIFT